MSRNVIETFVNVGSGFIVNFLLSFLIFPLFGYQPTLEKNAGITAVFTVAALVRSYLVRRYFDKKD